MPERENDPIYSDRYVAFLDILGFSNIVRESVSRPERAAELVKALNRIADRPSTFEVGDFFRDDFKGQSFSDCIVLSENASSRGLAHLLGVVTRLSIELLANGIMLRGGISKGKLHHSDKVVFEPALIEAYRLESTIARYPRVVADQQTYED